MDIIAEEPMFKYVFDHISVLKQLSLHIETYNKNPQIISILAKCQEMSTTDDRIYTPIGLPYCKFIVKSNINGIDIKTDTIIEFTPTLIELFCSNIECRVVSRIIKQMDNIFNQHEREISNMILVNQMAFTM